GQSEFQKNIDAVTRQLAVLPADTGLTVIGITDASFAQPYILLSARISPDPGYFGERLEQARADLKRVWRNRTARLAPTFKHTDIIGALFLASEVLQDSRSSGDRVLMILSDMQNSTRELNLESDVEPRIFRTQSANVPIANLSGVHVRVAGVD